MNHQTSIEVQKHLEPLESVLWSGQPRQGVMFRGSDVFLIPFSLLWGGLAICWEYTALTKGAPPFFGLFGIPFVVIGIYFIAGRFYVEAKQKAKTFYAVTSERVLIISGLAQRKVKSLALRTLSDVSMTESKDGTGSILFGQSFPFASLFWGMYWPGMEQFSGARLDTIDNAKQVYQLIREAQKKCGVTGRSYESGASRGDAL